MDEQASRLRLIRARSRENAAELRAEVAEKQATDNLGRAIRAENRAHVSELPGGRLEAALQEIIATPAQAVEIAARALQSVGVGEVAA
jgi:hypothetical protein